MLRSVAWNSATINACLLLYVRMALPFAMSLELLGGENEFRLPGSLRLIFSRLTLYICVSACSWNEIELMLSCICARTCKRTLTVVEEGACIDKVSLQSRSTAITRLQ